MKKFISLTHLITIVLFSSVASKSASADVAKSSNPTYSIESAQGRAMHMQMLQMQKNAQQVSAPSWPSFTASKTAKSSSTSTTAKNSNRHRLRSKNN